MGRHRSSQPATRTTAKARLTTRMPFSVRSTPASPSYPLFDPPGGPTDRSVAYLRLPSSRLQVCSDTPNCGARLVSSCTIIHCMATRPLTNAGPPVLTGKDRVASTRYLFVRRPLCFYDATVVLPGRPRRRTWCPGRAASPSANLSLLRSWRTTDQAGIRSRIPGGVRPPSRSGQIAAACPSSQTILINDVIQKVVTARAGEPKHEAGASPRHRVERYPVEARPGTEQEIHQLNSADRAGTQIVVPVAHVKSGLFLEAEYGQRLAESWHAYGKRVRKGLRASTRDPESRKPSHRCCPLLPTTPTQDGYARSSNPHY